MSQAVFYLKPVASNAAEAAAASFVSRAAQRVVEFFSFSAPLVPETVSHLLELADQYEHTQPSYAADLRHAALSHELTRH